MPPPSLQSAPVLIAGAGPHAPPTAPALLAKAQPHAASAAPHVLSAAGRRPSNGTLALLVMALACGSACSKPNGGGDPPAKSSAPARAAPLAVGDPAPQFEGIAHDGQRVRLSDFLGKAVVLYFYPKDGTPGCTAEAQGFRDEQSALAAASAVVIGVSADDNESHRAFAREHGLPFLLLPDTEHSIASAYGVGSFLGMSNRVTFVVDREGKIARVYPSVDPEKHARQILDDLQTLR